MLLYRVVRVDRYESGTCGMNELHGTRCGSGTCGMKYIESFCLCLAILCYMGGDVGHVVYMCEGRGGGECKSR